MTGNSQKVNNGFGAFVCKSNWFINFNYLFLITIHICFTQELFRVDNSLYNPFGTGVPVPKNNRSSEVPSEAVSAML